MRPSFPLSPAADPDTGTYGVVDTDEDLRAVDSSPFAYLLWLARAQWRLLLGAVVFGVIGLVSAAIIPALVGRAIDAGIAHSDGSALLRWSAILLGVGLVNAVTPVLRHRFAVLSFLAAAFRTVRVVTARSTRLGATLPRRLATGEVVSIGASDLGHLGGLMEVLGRFVGSIAAFVCVAVLMLSRSVTLGLVVLLGVPLLTAGLAPILRPLHHRQSEQRGSVGRLNVLATDIVSGLRVLRGIGGETTFASRYRRQSGVVREAGIRVARLQSLLDAAQILLPGIFVAVVIWLGARLVVDGSLTAGDLVAFYGFAAFLVLPMRNATDFADRMMRGLVAARRIVRVLRLEPELRHEPQGEHDEDAENDEDADTAGATVSRPGTPVRVPDSDWRHADLVDPDSGIRARHGALTAIVTGDLDEASMLAERLAGYTDGAARLGDVALRDVETDTVRDHILLVDPVSQLFSGELRRVLHPTADDTALRSALLTAAAGDAVDAVPGGLDGQVTEKARALSGGQRQRLVLARALAAEPDVLVMVEPTSAVDAHTEKRIADRLAGHRRGLTTALFTGSVLVTEQCDEVVFVSGGHAVARGKHRDLVATEPAYAAAMYRGGGDDSDGKSDSGNEPDDSRTSSEDGAVRR